MKDLSSADISWLKNHHPRNHKDYMRISAWSNALPVGFPRMVYLEVGWDCNLNCTFCSKPSRRTPERKMEFGDYWNVLEECAREGTYYLNLHFFNEPLLYVEELIDVLEHAKVFGIPHVAVTTNATPLTMQIMERLRDAGLDSLNISYEGANAANYERVRGVKSDAIATRIRRAAAVPNRPYMTICMMRTTETDEEVEAFGRHWSQVVDKVESRPVLEFLGRIEDVEHAVVPANRIPCRYLGDRLAVLADGTITACSVDLDGELSLGNVLDGDTLKGVWTSEKYRDLYSKHAFQLWDELPDPCRQCGSWDFTATGRSERYVQGQVLRDHGG